MKALIIVLLLPLFLLSCRKDENSIKIGNDKLIGNWINPQYNDTLVTYSRAKSLLENEVGISFKEGNTLIERKNNGWCGTPPITTADYNGTWTRNDSILNISVGYWGGMADYTWQIVALNDQELVIYVVNAQYHEGI